jgi:hypothetical protein
MTEVPKSAGESALRFSTAGEAIAYVGKHNLSRVEADPIFDANEIDRDDAWAMVEKARAAEAKSRELGKHGRQLTEPGAQSFGGHTIGRVQATPSKAAPDPEPEAAPTVTELSIAKSNGEPNRSGWSIVSWKKPWRGRKFFPLRHNLR